MSTFEAWALSSNDTLDKEKMNDDKIVSLLEAIRRLLATIWFTLFLILIALTVR